MSGAGSTARPDGAGWAGAEPQTRLSLRRAGYGSRRQRMQRQVRVVIRHELSLSLHLLLLVMSVIMWVPRLDEGFVLWVAFDRDLATASMLYAIVASLVAFMLGQRDIRNAVTELQAGTVASRRDVVLARMIGMILASWLYLSVLVGGTYLVGVVNATWGRPDIRLLLPLYAWPSFVMPMMVVLGERSTRLEAVRPIMWLVLAGVGVWFTHVVAWFPFGVSMIEAMSWPGPPPNTVPDDIYQRPSATGELWQWLLVGGGVFVVALLALPRRFGNWLPWTRLVGIGVTALAVVALVASMGLGLRNGTGYPARAVAGDLTHCITGGTYTACAHPAYVNMVEALEDDIDAVLAPLKGADVLPLRIEFVPTARLPTGNPPHVPPFPETVVIATSQYGFSGSDSFQSQFIQMMFTIEGWSTGDDTVRSVMEGWWMLELGFTSESSRALAYLTGDAGELPSGYDPPDLTPHIERFSSIPDDEQRAWLEANWDALRSGELTLEDLP